MIMSSVPQGHILTHTLFLLHINDIFLSRGRKLSVYVLGRQLMETITFSPLTIAPFSK